MLLPVIGNKAYAFIAKFPAGFFGRSRKNYIVSLIKIMAFVILLGNKILAVRES